MDDGGWKLEYAKQEIYTQKEIVKVLAKKLEAAERETISFGRSLVKASKEAKQWRDKYHDNDSRREAAEQKLRDIGELPMDWRKRIKTIGTLEPEYEIALYNCADELQAILNRNDK